MAATPLTPQRVKLAGLTPTDQGAFDAANGMVINNNDGRSIWVEVTSTHASNPIDLIFDTPNTVGKQALAIAQDSRTIPANGAKRKIGPFPVEDYGSSINMTVSGSGTLTIAAFQLGS